MHIKGQSRAQATLFPERLDELITEDNPVRVIDAFIDALMRRRKGIVEHPFGTLKRRMDGGKFLVRGLQKVKAEMALAVTAYNFTRAINVLGVPRLCQALAT